MCLKAFIKRTFGGPGVVGLMNDMYISRMSSFVFFCFSNYVVVGFLRNVEEFLQYLEF